MAIQCRNRVAGRSTKCAQWRRCNRMETVTAVNAGQKIMPGLRLTSGQHDARCSPASAPHRHRQNSLNAPHCSSWGGGILRDTAANSRYVVTLGWILVVVDFVGLKEPKSIRFPQFFLKEQNS